MMEMSHTNFMSILHGHQMKKMYAPRTKLRQQKKKDGWFYMSMTMMTTGGNMKAVMIIRLQALATSKQKSIRMYPPTTCEADI